MLRLRGIMPALAASLGIACSAGPGAPEDGRAVAAAFLDEIRAGRVGPAWDGTSVEFKSMMGLESLRDCVRRYPAMAGPAEFVEGHPIGDKGVELAEYTFKATAPPKTRGGRPRGGSGPATSTIRITTARVDGAWKVERLAPN